MDKASMLYNKFKSMFLVGEGEQALAQVLCRSTSEQKQYEEAKKGALRRAELAREGGEEGREGRGEERGGGGERGRREREGREREEDRRRGVKMASRPAVTA